MASFRKWVALLLVVASIAPGWAAKKYLFHIPWACSVVHTNGNLIGAGTIIEMDKVLVSVDNFNETVPRSDPPKPFYKVIDDIYVYAGSNYMDPSKLGSRKPSYVQKQKAHRFYVAFKRPEVNNRKWDIKMNPTEISEKAGVEYDVYGLAFNVGILVLVQPFVRSTYVLPVLVKSSDILGRTAQFKSSLDRLPEARSHTCVTYSWSPKLNRIWYHEVTYQPNKYCLEVFCSWNLLQCRQFPQKTYLMCFRSVKYSDVCPGARGAALYCPNFDHSVLAILTTAPSCGQRHMPGVYTTMPKIIDFFENALNVSFHTDDKLEYDLLSLPQKNSDYDGVP